MKYLGLFVILIVVIVGLVYGLLDMRGRERLKAVKAELLAAGEPLDLDTLLGEEPPEAENFVRHRFFNELREHPERAREKRTLIQSLNINQTPGLQRHREGRMEVWQLAKRKDIGRYLEKNSRDRPDGKEVLDKLSVWKVQMEEISKATRRPHSRWYGAEEEIQFNDPGHSAFMQAGTQLVHVYQLRALAHLEVEDPTAAVEDIETMLHLGNHYMSESSLIAMLVGVAQGSLAIQPLWEGLATGSLSEKNLERLATALARFDLDHTFRQAVRGECLYMMRVTREIQEDPGFMEKELAPLGLRSSVLASYKLIPKGIYSEFMATQVAFLQEHLIKDGLTFANFEKLENAEITTPSFLPKEFLHDSLKGTYTHLFRRLLSFQALLDNAQIAVALERHRFKHGTYPKTLVELAPDFLPEVPLDPINGEQRIYKIKDDGTPMFYSVGINKKDDGGIPHRRPELGDWVWQYSVPEDFDYEAYSIDTRLK